MNKTLSLLLIAAALAATLAYLWFSPEQVLKRAVEREGSAMAGSAVRVEKLSYSKQSGVFVLTGLSVANPPGFSQGDLLVAPVVEIALDPASLGQAVVRIERLVVSGPRLRIESGPGGSNFETLERRLNEQAVGPGAQRFLVDTLAIDDARARLPGGAEPELIGLRSHDLGAGRGGITAVELVRGVADDLGQRLRLASGIENIKSGIRNLLGE